MAFGDSVELTYCAIYDYWADLDRVIWEGWSDEIPVITIPYSALWSLLCVTKGSEENNFPIWRRNFVRLQGAAKGA
jgi:hypothetical protein